MTVQQFISEQPAVLEAVLRHVPPQLTALDRSSTAGSICLVGSGTSMNALVAAAPLLAVCATLGVRVQGPLAFVEEAGTGRPDDLTILLSQSGASTTSVEATKHAQACGGRVWTLTADRHSAIAKIARQMIEIPVGPEPVGPKTKGYTASLLTLILLARSLVGSAIEAGDFIAGLPRLIGAAREAAADLAARHAESDCVVVMGQGRHYATALEGSLKITEMSGRVAAGFDTEEAFHGRFHGLGPASLALFIAGTPSQHAMATEGAAVLSGLGVSSYVFNLTGGVPGAHDLAMPWPDAAGTPELDLISAIVPLQCLACELAKRRGWPPEQMRYPDLSRRLRIKIG
jgi:fructoselysine-6-P-deglycase FrlB-like protein